MHHCRCSLVIIYQNGRDVYAGGDDTCDSPFKMAILVHSRVLTGCKHFHNDVEGERAMVSWWQKTVAAAAGVAGLAGGAYYFLMRRPVPRYKGQVRLTGLHEAVEVITDRYSVPHIYAQNEDDM